jgi:hypothetical protein
LPSEDSLAVFAQLRQSPRLDLNDKKAWRVRPYRELDATNDKHLMEIDSESKPRGYWPVFKGESFDIWEPDRGPSTYYAWADPKEVLEFLQEKRENGARNSKSAFSECDEAWVKDIRTLPCHRPRIAFRDVTRATDSRTVRLALIPPKTFVNHLAPFILWPRGDEKDEAYLLGVLSSIPLDWYARRFVETHLTFFVLAPFPVPRPPRTSNSGSARSPWRGKWRRSMTATPTGPKKSASIAAPWTPPTSKTTSTSSTPSSPAFTD